MYSAAMALRLGRMAFFCLCMATLPGQLRAQAPDKFPADPIQYGQIDPRDLTEAPFAGDSTAGAVVLCDYGRSRIGGKGEGLQVVFERVTRIKILRKAGYDQATVEIPLYHRELNQEKVSGLRGCTYNLVNGQVVGTKLEPSGAFFEKRSDHVNVQKFTLPNVREGSVIEYAYTLSSDFLFNFQDWAFQGDIPVRWSEFRASVPSFYKYKIIYQSTQPFAAEQARVGAVSLRLENPAQGWSGQSTHITALTEDHRWAMRDVPALRSEAYTTTTNDYVDRIDFQLVGEQWPNAGFRDLSETWPKINQHLLQEETFGRQLERGHLLKSQVQPLAGRYPEIWARAAAVRELLMAAIRYDGTNRYSTETPPRKALEAHRGTAADVNLLLIAALRDAGLEAEPVLLSTRDHGQVSREFPLLDKFNYVIALVPLPGGKELLLDATEPLLPSGVLPKRCLNQTGRLIPSDQKAEGRWVELRPVQRYVHYQQVALKLDAQGSLSGKVHEEHGGYASVDAREELARLGEKKYLARLTTSHPGWSVPKLTVTNREDVAKPLALDYEFSHPAESTVAVETIYLSPLREFNTEQNPFRHDDRRFPVDFSAPQDETTVITLTLPEGYELTELPKPTSIALPEGGRYVYGVVSPTPGTVQITSHLNLDKPVYTAGEYSNLRELYRLMLARQGERLVVRKKSGG